MAQKTSAQQKGAAPPAIDAGLARALYNDMVLIPGKEETGPDPRRPWRLLALPAGAILLMLLAVYVVGAPGAPSGRETSGGVEAIARLLFTDYLFPFELTSVLLLAAMVGVLLLARRRA